MRRVICALLTAMLLVTVLPANATADPSGEEPPNYATSDGSEGDPYEIASWENLYWLSQNSDEWDKHYIQTADVTFPQSGSDDIHSWDSGDGFSPIGNRTITFTGSYAGLCHTIDGLFIDSDDWEVGLFGQSAGHISNVALTDADVFGHWGAGGLVYRNSGTIVCCHVTGAVDVGHGLNGGAGGLVAENFGTISNCYSTCSVDGVWAAAGGLVGLNYSTISDSYSTGMVTGLNTIGGLVGSDTGTVSDCFWDTDMSDQSDSAAGTGKTTDEMTDVRTFVDADWSDGLSAPWDFEDTWWMYQDHNDGYPYLQCQEMAYHSGTVEGTVTEYGTGDAIEGAVASCWGISSTSDASGSYAIDVPVPSEPVDIDVDCTHPDYFDATGAVTLPGATTVQADVQMRWSEIAAEPDSLNVFIDPDSTMERTVTVSNGGTDVLSYSCAVGYSSSQGSTSGEGAASITYDLPSDPPLSENSEFAPDNPGAGGSSSALEPGATWDVLYNFNCSDAAQPGIETDGIHIYTADWQTPPYSGFSFWEYGMDGTVVDSFNIGGVSGIKDMAYDGTYFYGGDTTSTIYVMDLPNRTLVDTIAVSCTGVGGVRHIAYDPGLDAGNGGFWIGNWNDIGAVDIDGNEIYGDLGCASSVYGSAYDPWSPGGPYLWLFSQDDSTYPSKATLVQFDIASQSLTGVVRDCSDAPGFSEGIAGGLAAYHNGRAHVLLANIQQNPNLIVAYELATWLSITGNGAGDVPAGGDETVTVTFDSSDIPEGTTKNADIVVSGNNPSGETVSVPVCMYVGTIGRGAGFSATPEPAQPGTPVQFEDESEPPGGCEINRWKWDFDGDGEVDSTVQNPAHVFESEGVHEVTLTVYADCGCGYTDSCRRTVLVEEKEEKDEPRPAEMSASYLHIDPVQVLPGQEVTVSANVCNDGEEAGSETASLMVNGQAEDSASVTVNGGSCQQVVFTTSRAVPGTYQVSIGGMTGQFSVLAPRTVTQQVPSQQDTGFGTVGVIAIAAVMVVLIAGLIAIFRRA